MRVDAVEQRDAGALGDLADADQSCVEVAAQHHDARSMRHRLRQLAQRHFSFGHHDVAADAGGGAVRGGARRGVSRRRADRAMRAGLHRLRHRHDHPAVLERPGGILPFELQPQLGAPDVARQRGSGDQRRVALAQRQVGRLFGEWQMGGPAGQHAALHCGASTRIRARTDCVDESFASCSSASASAASGAA